MDCNAKLEEILERIPEWLEDLLKNEGMIGRIAEKLEKDGNFPEFLSFSVKLNGKIYTDLLTKYEMSLKILYWAVCILESLVEKYLSGERVFELMELQEKIHKKIMNCIEERLRKGECGRKKLEGIITIQRKSSAPKGFGKEEIGCVLENLSLLEFPGEF